MDAEGSSWRPIFLGAGWSRDASNVRWVQSLAYLAWIVGVIWGASALGWARVMVIPPPLLGKVGPPAVLALTSAVLLLKKDGARPLGRLLMTFLLVGFPAWLYPHWLMARSQGRLTACKSNLRAIRQALETYRTDQQTYPTDIAALVGGHYLTSIPTCNKEDKAPVDSYSGGYRLQSSGKAFLLCCKGDHHLELVGWPDSPKIDQSGQLTY